MHRQRCLQHLLHLKLTTVTRTHTHTRIHSHTHIQAEWNSLLWMRHVHKTRLNAKERPVARAAIDKLMINAKCLSAASPSREHPNTTAVDVAAGVAASAVAVTTSQPVDVSSSVVMRRQHRFAARHTVGYGSDTKSARCFVAASWRRCCAASVAACLAKRANCGCV